LGFLSRPPEADRSIAADLCDEWGLISLEKASDGGKSSREYLGHLLATEISALLENKHSRVAHVNRTKSRTSVAQLEILGEHNPATTTHLKQPGFVSLV